VYPRIAALITLLTFGNSWNIDTPRLSQFQVTQFRKVKNFEYNISEKHAEFLLVGEKAQ
jgi:hypothetical protein